ncbi:MAG: NAD-dependent deacylase [Proteobacteria bacterium]|nr:MAG: NAD-dependent deacylase [Pseudomonadota bacterium]
MRQKLVVLTGAGMSAESGLKTFRDMGGLWEEHEVCKVASFSAWQKNKELVLRFYNDRRSQLSKVNPNAGHYILAELEQYYDVQIITQNVDDLHELAGSKSILHLHGELTKARSTQDDSLIYAIGYKAIEMGDVCELGSQLRPHIVWFGEAVPEIGNAANLVESADILVVIGTSLSVYPAAGLVDFVGPDVPIYLIDPHKPHKISHPNFTYIEQTAVNGVAYLKQLLVN